MANRDLSTMQGLNDQLKDAYQEVVQENCDKDEEIKGLKDQVKELERSNTKLKELNERLDTLPDELRQKIANMERKHGEAVTELERKNTQLESELISTRTSASASMI